jgi:hypothetical protein
MKHALGGEPSVWRTLFVALADKGPSGEFWFITFPVSRNWVKNIGLKAWSLTVLLGSPIETQSCPDLGRACVLKSVSCSRVHPGAILEETDKVGWHEE